MLLPTSQKWRRPRSPRRRKLLLGLVVVALAASVAGNIFLLASSRHEILQAAPATTSELTSHLRMITTPTPPSHALSQLISAALAASYTLIAHVSLGITHSLLLSLPGVLTTMLVLSPPTLQRWRPLVWRALGYALGALALAAALEVDAAARYLRAYALFGGGGSTLVSTVAIVKDPHHGFRRALVFWVGVLQLVGVAAIRRRAGEARAAEVSLAQGLAKLARRLGGLYEAALLQLQSLAGLNLANLAVISEGEMTSAQTALEKASAQQQILRIVSAQCGKPADGILEPLQELEDPPRSDAAILKKGISDAENGINGPTLPCHIFGPVFLARVTPEYRKSNPHQKSASHKTQTEGKTRMKANERPDEIPNEIPHEIPHEILLKLRSTAANAVNVEAFHLGLFCRLLSCQSERRRLELTISAAMAEAEADGHALPVGELLGGTARGGAYTPGEPSLVALPFDRGDSTKHTSDCWYRSGCKTPSSYSYTNPYTTSLVADACASTDSPEAMRKPAARRPLSERSPTALNRLATGARSKLVRCSPLSGAARAAGTPRPRTSAAAGADRVVFAEQVAVVTPGGSLRVLF